MILSICINIVYYFSNLGNRTFYRLASNPWSYLLFFTKYSKWLYFSISFVSGALAEQFSFLLRVAISGQYKSLSPVEFKKTVGKVKSSFSGFDQQDSQEFLALMMDKLHEDVNTVSLLSQKLIWKNMHHVVMKHSPSLNSTFMFVTWYTLMAKTATKWRN